ncbi:MAG: PP2C family protein-serine/threonine phosphatase [Gammaproteobacteria bacterium]|jgi:phosphoserine phosphatase RsbU/P|nr:PP2C family protein-serine/threonine phosphatase [Gammaproteobacteria bacterium]MBU1817598.1 PP2C family protein-serine/threonine phosphatase [Gammaproteobacteria bacterium]
MQLRRRIMLILLLAMALLVTALGTMGWLGEQRWAQRYNEALLQGQRIAWDKLQNENLDRQDALARRLLEDPAFHNLQAPGAAQRIDRLLANAMRQAPGLRIDILGPGGALVSTTEPAFDPQPLAEYGWVKTAMEGAAGVVRGLSQVAPREYAWVVVHGFEGGALAIGQDVSRRLPELASYLGGEIFLVNMRGKETLGTQPGSLAATGAVVPVRSPQTLILAVDARSGASDNRTDGALQLISQPVVNPDKRVVGALVWMQDVSAQHRSDRFFNLAAAGGALLFAALIVMGLAAYMQHAMEPLTRSVGVLKALASGATDASLDDGEEEAEDESGAIARGVVAIRSELLNLETLRQERIRTRHQQERLIRDQLRSLAESLDPTSRDEILAALGTRTEAPVAPLAEALPQSSTNQLAELAGILGRMSGLVSTQQSRLLKLLRELQAAVQTQAMLASLQQELEIARQMQLSILPRSAPDVGEVDIAATMIPAKEVGGDFYDYFPIDDEHLAVVVADVSGKGVPAAFFMAISRTLLKSNALFLRVPGPTIAALNDQLCAENDQMMFVTVFYGVLHLRSGRLTYVNAGHNPPVWLREGKASYLERGSNMALAVMEGQEYVEGEIVLSPGETLLLYTDGVTEANNAEGTLFGETALLDAMEAVGADPVHKGHAGGVPQRVVQAVRTFEAGAAQADDITVVAITYQGVRS